VYSSQSVCKGPKIRRTRVVFSCTAGLPESDPRDEAREDALEDALDEALEEARDDARDDAGEGAR